MSILSENLQDLLLESNLDYKAFAAKIGISASAITNYIKYENLPTVNSIVKIADYFNCSIDYLLGRVEDDWNSNFCKCPPFCERLKFLKEHFGVSNKFIYEHEKISKNRYFDWLSGKRVPTLESVIALAEIFDCSVDFVIGREN